MPPSRHSSSSRSSSRSSSSRSSHSRSSSRSSSHSRSSHSSSYGGYSRHTGSSHSSTRYVTPPRKQRINQPTGYRGTAAMSTSMFRSTRHDYVYYPDSWRDEITGRNFESGFYDELGNHYNHVVIKNGANYETRASCDYCGTEIKLNWTEGALPSCPNCGALLHEVMQDAIVEDKLQDVPQYVPSTYTGSTGKGWIGKFITSMLVVFLGICGMTAAMKALQRKNLSSYNAGLNETVQATADENDEGFFVEEIGRTCYWYDEYESYYDEESDCYFWYKEADEVWEYWYEGISSDYGDYGWMQYDYFDEAWYIEVSDGDWQVLPDKYDASSLWHMKESGTGRYDGQNVIYVEEIDRECGFIFEESNYYDPETKCHFWYDDLVDPPMWQYWYDDISSDYGDYGWMEYDEDEECWYIEESESSWIKLPESYDTSSLWHIESK